jgi:hypothetical protein
LRGPGEIDQSGIYKFVAGIGDEGQTHSVEVVPYVEGYGQGIPCWFYTTVTYSCGDFNGDAEFNLLDITGLIDYIYLAGPGPFYDYMADVNASETFDILDVTDMIATLYMDQYSLNCNLIKNDYPVIEDNWWLYETFDSLTSTTDTITVSVSEYNTLRYNMSPGTNYYDELTFSNDVVTSSGFYPDNYYSFPLMVGDSWTGGNNIYSGPSIDSVIAFEPITAPAGTFDAYHIKRTWGCGEECVAFNNEYFAEGIGPVFIHFWEFDIFGETYHNETWTLLNYNIRINR